MRPTVRGLAVGLVAAAASVAAVTAGPRALNAVAGPALVALGAGALQVGLADPPTVERTDPPAGFPGDTRTVEFTVDGGALGRVVDALPDGVAGDDHEVQRGLPATVSYEVELAERGVWTVGPPAVVVSDVLGLFVRRVSADATATLVVYPPVAALEETGPLARLVGEERGERRRTFESVREYAPGDPLRDVHWKSSAKRAGDDLVVKEFTGDRQRGAVRVAASAAPGHTDEMATAAASVAHLGLTAGLSVGLSCPAGTVPVGRGESHRTQLLGLLARTGGGDASEADGRPDVAVHADADGVTVTVDGKRHRLDLPTDASAEEVSG